VLQEKNQLSDEEKSQLPETDLLLMAPPMQAAQDSINSSAENAIVGSAERTILESAAALSGIADLPPEDNEKTVISPPPKPIPPKQPADSSEKTQITVPPITPREKPSEPSSSKGFPSLPPTLAASKPMDNQASASILGVPSDDEDDMDDEPTTVRRFPGFQLDFGAAENTAKPQQTPPAPAPRMPAPAAQGKIEELSDNFGMNESSSSSPAAVKAVHRGYVAPREAITPPQDIYDDGDSIEIGGGSFDENSGEDDVTRQLRRPDFKRNW
jgi:hypothetical protein